MHELVFLFNGVENEEQLRPYHDLAFYYGLTYKSLRLKKGWDLEAYRWAASQIDAAYILFLNSYSRFRGDNWLAHFITAMSQPGVGIVGATGSYHSIFSMIQYETSTRWEREKSFNENFRKYKLLVKNFILYRFWFPPFPNPHVRTNAFLVERKVFVDLSLIPIKKKYDAYRLESGRIGFTRQIIKRGLKPIVVGKNGEVYEIAKWRESNTFWIDDQANLLVSDNQTEKFMEADSQQRKFFTFIAWGP
ncbi:MAG: hypothetical protein ACXVBH_14230 [Flavisolibacter sp.]